MDSRPTKKTTGVEPAKAGKAPKRGVSGTSLAPGSPAANTAGSSAGAGLAVATTAAKTKKSLSEQRISALQGTSTDPSNIRAKTATANTTAGSSASLHPSPPLVAPQATFHEAPAPGQTGAVSCTEDIFASAWKAPTRKGKGKGRKTTPQTQCSCSHPSGPTAPTSQGKRRERPTRKERRHERRRGGKGKAPQSKQVAATSSVNPTKPGKLSFSGGKRSQAEAGTSRSKLGQSPTTSAGVPAKEATKTQQPNGNDQAVAKRALNETLSPRGEHKRPRLDQSQRVPSRSYAQAASATLNVAITCDRRGSISQGVSDQVIAAIQERIISEASSPTQDTPGPAFIAKPHFADGVLKLWCGDDHTLAWLKKTVSSLALPASTSLVVRSQSEIQKRVRCGIAIPDDRGVYKDSTVIGRALCYQNPKVEVKRWVVLHAEKQRTCWFVVLGIPEDQIPTLMSCGRRLSIGLGAVYVKFQGPNGRFVDVPQGWDPTTRQLLDAGETIPPPNNPEATTADPAEAAVSAAPAAAVTAVPSSEGELDDVMLSPASNREGDGFDEGDLFAGLRLEGDEEDLASDGVPFVDL